MEKEKQGEDVPAESKEYRSFEGKTAGVGFETGFSALLVGIEGWGYYKSVDHNGLIQVCDLKQDICTKANKTITRQNAKIKLILKQKISKRCQDSADCFVVCTLS